MGISVNFRWFPRAVLPIRLRVPLLVRLPGGSDLGPPKQLGWVENGCLQTVLHSQETHSEAVRRHRNLAGWFLAVWIHSRTFYFKLMFWSCTWLEQLFLHFMAKEWRLVKLAPHSKCISWNYYSPGSLWTLKYLGSHHKLCPRCHGPRGDQLFPVHDGIFWFFHSPHLRRHRGLWFS